MSVATRGTAELLHPGILSSPIRSIYLHFTGEKTEAQNEQTTCRKLWKLRFSVCFLTSIYRPLKLQDLYCFKEDRTLIGCLRSFMHLLLALKESSSNKNPFCKDPKEIHFLAQQCNFILDAASNSHII